MKILLTGITGSIGGVLAPRLIAAGHDLVGLSRRPRSELLANSIAGSVELAQADVNSGAGLDQALKDIEVAYYLIHSMESPVASPAARASAPGSASGDLTTDNSFVARELTGARNFASAATRAGVRRIVFLGGMLPVSGEPSPHLASRLAVEQTLLAAVPDSIALRASIVVGDQSRSFRLLVRLVERMPVLPLPAWRKLRTTPIDQRDAIEALCLAASAPDVPSHSLDLAGPDTVSYGELIAQISDVLLLNRPIIPIDGVTATPLTSIFAAFIADEDPGLVTPLMHSLGADILPRKPDAAEVLGFRQHSLRAAIERAIGSWENEESLRAR